MEWKDEQQRQEEDTDGMLCIVGYTFHRKMEQKRNLPGVSRTPDLKITRSYSLAP